MASLNNSGIVFSNVKTSGVRINGGPIIVDGLSPGTDPDGGTGIVQMYDVDWNGAVLPDANLTTAGSVTINTTGQLLNLINEMQKEIYVLSAAVIAIGTR